MKRGNDRREWKVFYAVSITDAYRHWIWWAARKSETVCEEGPFRSAPWSSILTRGSQWLLVSSLRQQRMENDTRRGPIPTFHRLNTLVPSGNSSRRPRRILIGKLPWNWHGKRASRIYSQQLRSRRFEREFKLRNDVLRLELTFRCMYLSYFWTLLGLDPVL